MSREIRIGATEPAPDSPAFAVSRDSAGILLAVRDKAAPQFAVSRDAGGILLSVLPSAQAPYEYTIPVIYFGYGEGHVRAWNPDTPRTQARYEAARAGTVGTQVLGNFKVGQNGATYYELFQAYLRFDTSVIPVGETVVGATLTLYGIDDFSDTDFIIEARVYDCGDRIEASDYVAGNDLAAKTLFATRDTALGGLTPYGTPVLFTEAAGAATAINTSGVTGLLLCSDQTRLDIAPTTTDHVVFADSPPLAYLTITTNGPA